jgi:hypothetical protein
MTTQPPQSGNETLNPDGTVSQNVGPLTKTNLTNIPLPAVPVTRNISLNDAKLEAWHRDEGCRSHG